MILFNWISSLRFKDKTVVYELVEQVFIPEREVESPPHSKIYRLGGIFHLPHTCLPFSSWKVKLEQRLCRGRTYKGLAQTIKGFSKTFQVLPETIKGFPKTIQGLTKTIKGFIKTIQGFQKTIKGFYETIKGFARTIKGFGLYRKRRPCMHPVCIPYYIYPSHFCRIFH